MTDSADTEALKLSHFPWAQADAAEGPTTVAPAPAPVAPPAIHVVSRIEVERDERTNAPRIRVYDDTWGGGWEAVFKSGPEANALAYRCGLPEGGTLDELVGRTFSLEQRALPAQLYDYSATFFGVQSHAAPEPPRRPARRRGQHLFGASLHFTVLREIWTVEIQAAQPGATSLHFAPARKWRVGGSMDAEDQERPFWAMVTEGGLPHFMQAIGRPGDANIFNSIGRSGWYCATCRSFVEPEDVTVGADGAPTGPVYDLRGQPPESAA